MPKKQVLVGAPAYMAQYTALMTVLLAFFIILNTLSEQQESGFNVGIGDVKMAFGLEGGLGLNQFFYQGKGAGHPRNPKSTGEAEGIDEDLMKNGGGPGNTDVDAGEINTGQYLCVKIPFDFKTRESKITKKMRDYLEKIGTGFALFDYHINIRCYANEYEDKGDNEAYNRNCELASKRAVRILEALHSRNGIPYDHMVALGYPDKTCFQITKKKMENDKKLEKEKKETGEKKKEVIADSELPKKWQPEQATYFYLFFPSKPKIKVEKSPPK